LGTKKLKIFTANKIMQQPVIEPGYYQTDQKTYLHFACTDGYIEVIDMQLEGKKRMDICEFLRGYRF
jgi:methionyl-tRNA formyltransferase